MTASSRLFPAGTHHGKVLVIGSMTREERGKGPLPRRLSWLSLLTACALSPGFAAAAPNQTDRSLAQSLFEQGKRLMAAGKHAEACPKLEESQRLDPGGGTLLNLALCHELSGKIASAWAEFNEALSIARRDGRQDRIKAAQEHISALEPKLPSLTLIVVSPVEDQELRMDGALIGRAAWGTPLSVDPGAHELSAKAAGKSDWTSSLTIAVGEKRTFRVPQLETAEEQAPAGAAAQPPARSVPATGAETPVENASGSPGRRTAGWVVGGLGVAALGVGGYFGLQTFAKRNESDKLCPTDSTCSDQGVTYNEQAYTNAWISNIGIGLGVAGVALGAYLVLSSGEPARTAKLASPVRWDVAAVANPYGGELRARGSW